MDKPYIVFLIEDASGEKLVREVLKNYDSKIQYSTRGFKGIGTIPKGSNVGTTVKTQKLLNDLPNYLKGISTHLATMSPKTAIFVVLDCDEKNCVELKNSLLALVPTEVSTDVVYCIAIEEMEAWLLGDSAAVIEAYPNANRTVLEAYVPDSIVGTWEKLADAVYPGGATKLKKDATSYHEIGGKKCEWAEEIGRRLDLSRNKSPSFNYFISKLNSLSI